MMMDRRDFIVGGAALVAVAPALAAPPPLPSRMTNLRAPVLMIHGWSALGDDAIDREPIDAPDQYWITINGSWRTAWR